MRRIVFVALITLAISYDFSDFVTQFNKTYDEEEYAIRSIIFAQNYTLINDVNSKNLSYTLAVTNMTDWTGDEMNSIIYI